MLKSSGSSCLISGRVEKGGYKQRHQLRYVRLRLSWGGPGPETPSLQLHGQCLDIRTGQTWGMIESTRRYHTMRGRAAAAASVETRGKTGGVNPTRATDRILEARPDESFARRRPTTTVQGRESMQVRG